MSTSAHFSAEVFFMVKCRVKICLTVKDDKKGVLADKSVVGKGLPR